MFYNTAAAKSQFWLETIAIEVGVAKHIYA